MGEDDQREGYEGEGGDRWATPSTSELTFSCSKRMRFHVLYMQFILMMFCISPTDCHSPLQGEEEEEEEATKEIEKEEK